MRLAIVGPFIHIIIIMLRLQNIYTIAVHPLESGIYDIRSNETTPFNVEFQAATLWKGLDKLNTKTDSMLSFGTNLMAELSR